MIKTIILITTILLTLNLMAANDDNSFEINHVLNTHISVKQAKLHIENKIWEKGFLSCYNGFFPRLTKPVNYRVYGQYGTKTIVGIANFTCKPIHK